MGRAGRVVLGSVRGAGLADFASLETFTAPGGKAFTPVVQGSGKRSLLVGWRDASRSGTGWIRAATLNSHGIAGADLSLTWGHPSLVAREQFHKMALVSLPRDRFGVLFAAGAGGEKHTPATPTSG